MILGRSTNPESLPLSPSTRSRSSIETSLRVNSAEGPTKTLAWPAAREHYTRDRTFDVEHIQLDLALNDRTGTVAGTVTTTIVPIRGIRQVEFDSVDLRIHKVRLLGQKPKDLPFEVLPEKLRIALPKSFREGQPLVLEVRYEGRPRKGLFFIRPSRHQRTKPFQVWSQGEAEDNRYWFPCYDYPNDKATSEVILTVREPFVALSNGRLVSVEHDQKRKQRRFHWKQEIPHPSYLIAIAVGEFAEVEDRYDGVPIRYYVRKGDERRARCTFRHTPKMMKFFSDKIDYAYPFSKYVQVAISDFHWSGMENTSMTTVTDRALVGEELRLEADPDGLVAHELAHQWWGDLVTTKNWAHLWLNEGFATYFDALFTEHLHGKDEFQYKIHGDAQEYFDEDRKKYRRPIVTHVYTEPEDVFDRHTYQKGALVLHMLRFVLGEVLFWKAIGHYARRFATKSVETSDFKNAIEEATGQSLDSFFNQWIYRAGYPELEVQTAWEERRKWLRVTVKQVQKQEHDTPLFRTPLEIALDFGKKQAVHRVEIHEAEQSFFLPCPAKPRAVEVDPNGWVLKALRMEKSKPELLYELRHSPAMLGRLRAAEALGRIPDDEVVTALADALSSDSFYGVRREAARALAKIPLESALKALLGAMRDRDPRVRQRVARSLGWFQNPRAVEGLLGLLRREKSDYVLAQVFRALGKTKSPKALDWIGRGLKRTSHNEVIRIGCLEGLALLEDLRGIRLALRFTEKNWPERVRFAASAALGELWETHKPSQKAIRDRLLSLLGDPDHWVRRGALEALGQVLDPLARQAVEAASRNESLGLLRRTARESLRKLEQKQEERNTFTELRREVSRIQEENRELKTRLAVLEGRLEGVAPRRDLNHPSRTNSSHLSRRNALRRASGRSRK